MDDSIKFVDRKGRRLWIESAATTRNEGSSGSAMPLCGIVLPPSKKSRESYIMLFSQLMPKLVRTGSSLINNTNKSNCIDKPRSNCLLLAICDVISDEAQQHQLCNKYCVFQ